jgi:hypothetical protein
LSSTGMKRVLRRMFLNSKDLENMAVNKQLCKPSG